MIIIITTPIVINYSFESYSQVGWLMVSHWSLRDSRSPQVSWTLLSILDDLNNTVVWMVCTCPLISKSSSPFNNLSSSSCRAGSTDIPNLSRHSSQSFIAPGRSSGQHPVSSHCCWMYVRAGRPAFARSCGGGGHKSTSLMSSSLLLLQCPACLVHLTWIVFVIGGRLWGVAAKTCSRLHAAC